MGIMAKRDIEQEEQLGVNYGWYDVWAKEAPVDDAPPIAAAVHSEAFQLYRASRAYQPTLARWIDLGEAFMRDVQFESDEEVQQELQRVMDGKQMQLRQMVMIPKRYRIGCLKEAALGVGVGCFCGAYESLNKSKRCSGVVGMSRELLEQLSHLEFGDKIKL